MKANILKYIFFFLLLNYFIFGNFFLPEIFASPNIKNNSQQNSKKSKITQKGSSSKTSQKDLTRKRQASVKIASNKNPLFSRSSTDPSERGSTIFHVVKKGDTLYKIAKQYSVSVEEVRRFNNLKSDKLQLGQKLAIPTNNGIRNGAQPQVTIIPHSTALSRTEISREPQRDDTGYIYHTVQPGETLYSISLNYGVSLEEIKKLNNLESNIIAVGQRLKIPRNPQETPGSAFNLEKPLKDLKQEEETLQSKFEKNVMARNKILTPSMLSKEDELALKRKFVELSTYYADSRYRLGGNGDGYLDCSSFVKLVFRDLGINLPRSSARQFMVGVPVEEHELIPGDLVFFRTRGKTISHVGIYIGDNRFIHISSSRKRIAIDSLDDPYFRKRYAGAKRVLNGEVLEYFQDYLQKREPSSEPKFDKDKLSKATPSQDSNPQEAIF